MKIIDNILDKYFEKKVVILIKEHFEANYNFVVTSEYDDIYHKTCMFASYHNDNKYITVNIIAFPRSSSPVVLIKLLLHGWSELEETVSRQIKDIEEDL